MEMNKTGISLPIGTNENVNPVQAKLDFLNAVRNKTVIDFVPINGRVLIKESYSVKLSALAVANIHSSMSGEARANALRSLGVVRKLEIISIAKDLTDDPAIQFTVGDEPSIDLVNTLGVKYINLRNNTKNLLNISIHFSKLNLVTRQELIKLDNEVIIEEYMLVQRHSIEGIYR